MGSFKNYQFNKEFTLKYKYFKIGLKDHKITLFLKVREAVKHPEGGRGPSNFWPNATKS